MLDTSKVSCFLPCRQGSQRVPRKNIKPFGGFSHGLVEVKLTQLLSCNSIDEVVLSTNDEEILNFANGLASKKLRLHKRNESLSASDTSTDDLVAHALELIPEGEILWTHVTSPFVNEELYTEVISKYREVRALGFDSLMSTTPIHGFLWRDGKPVNYDRAVEKWPRTQTIKPLQEVNSAVFLAPCDIYRQNQDRIGHNPYLYEMNKLVSHDVDWPEDFILAECIAKEGVLPL